MMIIDLLKKTRKGESNENQIINIMSERIYCP
jgi:hypothetical protein